MRRSILAALGGLFGYGVYRGLRRYQHKPARRLSGESRAAFIDRAARPVLLKVERETEYDATWRSAA